MTCRPHCWAGGCRRRPRSGWSAGALGLGTFLATAVGTRLRIHRPALLQAGGILIVTVDRRSPRFSCTTCCSSPLLCLVTAVASGLAKLAVDAVIQERLPERVRASAFAHSETLLMFAWVTGGALGLIPFNGRLGLGVLAGFLALGLARAIVVSGRLRKERLRGAPAPEDFPDGPTQEQPAGGREPVTVDLSAQRGSRREPAGQRKSRWRRGGGRPADAPTSRTATPPAPRTAEPPPRQTEPTRQAEPTRPSDTPTRPDPARPNQTRVLIDPDADSPAGYHLYRPSGTDPTLDLRDEP